MKKLTKIMCIVSALMLIATLAYATGVCVDTYKSWGKETSGTRVHRIRWTCTADSAGAFAAKTTDREFHGYAVMGITNPGSTMTDNYDISVTDGDGVDIFGDGAGTNNQLLNRDTITSEAAQPYMDARRRVDSAITATITGNTANASVTVLDVYIVE